jgi:hypothetical protein
MANRYFFSVPRYSSVCRPTLFYFRLAWESVFFVTFLYVLCIYVYADFCCLCQRLYRKAVVMHIFPEYIHTVCTNKYIKYIIRTYTCTYIINVCYECNTCKLYTWRIQINTLESKGNSSVIWIQYRCMCSVWRVCKHVITVMIMILITYT